MKQRTDNPFLEGGNHMKLPLGVYFSGKVVVVTGAGGVLCSEMAKAAAAAGAAGRLW